MKKINFHAQMDRPPICIQGDSTILQKMLAAVLEPYFTVTENGAPLTVLCPGDGQIPALPRRGKYLVICDVPSDREQVVTLPRPLDLEEFLQTVRMQYSMDGYTGAEDYQCDDRHRTVTCRGQTVTLTEKEYALFQILYGRMGEIVAKDALTELLWDAGNNNACQVYIAYLRKKLESIAGAGVLTSVRGKGYVLHPPQ